MTIAYRVVDDTAGFVAVAQLENRVWGHDPQKLMTPPHLLRVITHTGGIVYGAYDGDHLVGCVFAFATHVPHVLWSHVAAVDPEYQRRGIGLQLKHIQRDWALAQGYTLMQWTMDPLMSANAHFNYHLLGAQANVYHTNFYGIANDAINAGIATDRLQAHWPLDQPREQIDVPNDLPFALNIDAQEQPITQAIGFDAPYYAVEIPFDYGAIKHDNRELALQWRAVSGQVLRNLFNKAYTIVAFERSADQRCWYVLRQDG